VRRGGTEGTSASRYKNSTGAREWRQGSWNNGQNSFYKVNVCILFYNELNKREGS